jgi:hypothetical protein
MADTRTLSFVADIRPLFTDADIEHMKRYGLDLSSRDDVAKHATNILAVLTAGTMPPPADGGEPWSQEMCGTFRRWMEQGYP